MARSGVNLRKKERRPFRMIARISIDSNTTLIPCTLSDISEIGARVLLEDDQGDLPIIFRLILAPGGPRRECRVIWRDGITVGVAFIGAAKYPGQRTEARGLSFPTQSNSARSA
jgi:PilZ domain